MVNLWNRLTRLFQKKSNDGVRAPVQHPFDVLNSKYLCPDCGKGDFILGPSGGNATNIKCAACGSKWWFAPPFTPERIDNGDEFYPPRRVVNLRREFAGE